MRKLICLFITLVFSSLAFAVDPEALPMTEWGEVDISHDFPKNDPSRGARYFLKKLIPQVALLKEELMIDLNPFRSQNGDLNSLPKSSEYSTLLRSNPSSFDLLKLHSDRYVPKLENGPTFINADHEFKGISDREYGYCWGFATLVRYFHTLVFWKKEVSSDVPNPSDQKAWMAYYQSKIDLIVSGKATEISGFSNFREFSMVPMIELRLKLAAMNAWKTRIIQMKTPGIFRSSMKPMRPDQTTKLVSELKSRIARGEMPKILFTALFSEYVEILGLKLGSKDIHASLVHHVREESNGTIYLDLWDINFYAESMEKKPITIEIRPNGEFHFPPWYEEKNPHVVPAQSSLLGQVLIAPENDRETVQMVKSLEQFCNKNLASCSK